VISLSSLCTLHPLFDISTMGGHAQKQSRCCQISQIHSMTLFRLIRSATKCDHSAQCWVKKLWSNLEQFYNLILCPLVSSILVKGRSYILLYPHPLWQVTWYLQLWSSVEDVKMHRICFFCIFSCTNNMGRSDTCTKIHLLAFWFIYRLDTAHIF
jgi:hypothetical protein